MRREGGSDYVCTCTVPVSIDAVCVPTTLFTPAISVRSVAGCAAIVSSVAATVDELSISSLPPRV